MHAGFIAAEGTELRDEDRKKVREVEAFLREIALHATKAKKDTPFVLVDAAAGKSCLGLLAAKLVFEPLGRAHRIHIVERDPGRVRAARDAAARLDLRAEVVITEADVSDAEAFPAAPSLVVALHACGSASDAVIDTAIAIGARSIALVPCCTGRGVAGQTLAESLEQELHLPRCGPIRRRFVEAIVDSERVLRLEAAGYATEAFELVPTTITPYNILLRGRLLADPTRIERAGRDLTKLRSRHP
ncbi:MAG: methyltransferase [Polyangiaceae bacterium]|nr:methyltransferase [Polyangiaceae bacterium]